MANRAASKAALAQARKRIADLEAMLAESELAVTVYLRAADMARRETEEHRRRRLDLEQEMALAYPKQKPRRRKQPSRPPLIRKAR